MNEPVTERKMSQLREGSLKRVLGKPRVFCLREAIVWVGRNFFQSLTQHLENRVTGRLGL